MKKKKLDTGMSNVDGLKEVKDEKIKGEGLLVDNQSNSTISTPHSIVEEPQTDSEIEHPTSEINKLPTANSKQQTETMEVHHHPEVEKKGLKEYFLEGLMIFLAVTMGFFAETMRENISESGKAKELAKSLYQEVYADSVIMQSKIKMRIEKDKQLEYFRRYVADSSLTHLSGKFYPCYVWSFILTTSIIFEPNDGILNQLKNSGTLRYFKGTGLQNSISRFNVAILNLRNRNSQEYAFIDEFVRPFTIKHFDFEWEDAFTQHGKLNINQQLAQINYHSPVPSRLKDLKDFSREEADGVAGYYLLITRTTKQITYDNYITANHQVLQELRKEYNFKNE